MAINFEYTIVEGTLLIEAHGIDDSIKDVLDYGKNILELAIHHQTTRVLCDERDLIYNISIPDSYETAKTMAVITPRVAKVAIVCNIRYQSESEFWGNVATNRGLRVRFFFDIDNAWTWIRQL